MSGSARSCFFVYRQHTSIQSFRVTSIKIDPCINVDAGTMNYRTRRSFHVGRWNGMRPDMGNYERFLNKDILSANYMTTGAVYQSIINKERAFEYEGRCVSVVPDVPIEILGKIDNAVKETKPKSWSRKSVRRSASNKTYYSWKRFAFLN